MKGLYFQQSSANEEITFVFQERVRNTVSSLNSIHKPEKVTWAEAAGTVRDGVRAYTALHYLSHLSPGKSVLIMDGASALGTIAIQLAQHRGARVISTASSLEDKQCLERFRPPLARVVDISNGKAHIAESCLEETGGLGVDIVLDAGVRLYSRDDDASPKAKHLPHKHDIITLLAVGGHWVTTEENLQVSAGTRKPHLVSEVTESGAGAIAKWPQLDEPIPLYEAKVSMEVVQKNQARKKQVVQF
uniref:Quinone oxidoreductase-like 1 (Predicted) n=1 Tax=Sorex araneus TaxID=42254 RepID=B3EX18_SORAR|nr:quinone oxidoreductase-like 1 (predicted) [Sorex araneus]